MSEVARAYHEVRNNVATFVEARPALTGDRVPACPEWTVRDLLAHLVGIATIVIGRLSGWPPAGRRPSTDLDPGGLLDEWDRLGERVEQLVAEQGGGDVMLMDAFTHELDLRATMGIPFPTCHPAFEPAFAVVRRGFAGAVESGGLPGLLLRTGDDEWAVGGEPSATVTAPGYDLYRSLTGRRTHGQIAALGWSSPPDPWRPAFSWGPFSPPSAPVER
jgi:uncharacterized protein (TIGR03083 family)